MSTAKKPPAAKKLNLVYDEELCLGDRNGQGRRFRVRIYMGRNYKSSVLISPHPDDGTSPALMASKIATHVFHSWLRRGEFDYFEIPRKGYVNFVQFDAQGDGKSRYFHRSYARVISQGTLEKHLGCPVPE